MRFLAVVSILFTTVLGAFASPLVERASLKSIAVVLTDLTDTIVPLADQLLYATSENVTQATLKPIIDNMSTAVTGAIHNMKSLAGQSTDVIMASVDDTGVLSVSDIASLLADVTSLILDAANAVLSVVDPTSHSLIQSLLVALVKVVFDLLSVVLPLISGLLSPFLALLAPVLSIVSSLGLTSLLGQLLGGLLGGL